MRPFLLLLLFGIAFSGIAQRKTPVTPVVKKPLSHAVYDAWKEIPYKSLTPDGNHAVFAINPQDGDGWVFFSNLNTGAKDSIARAEGVNITYDSRFAMFKIKPSQKVIKELRRQKKKKEDMPRDTMGIYTFATRAVERIPEVRSFRIPEKNGGWLAFQMEPPREDKSPTAARTGNGKKKLRKYSDENGYRLVLRNLSTRKEMTFGYVKDYIFAKQGQGMMFISTGNDSTMKAGVYWFDLLNEKLQAIFVGKSKYKIRGLSIHEDGGQAAFLVDTDTTKALVRHYALYHWKAGEDAASLLDIERSMGIPQNWIVNENYTPVFSKDGSRLFFGSAPIPVVQDTTLLTEEIVQVEIWGGEDDYIYPQQNKQLDTDRKRSYLGVIDLANKQVMQLADREVPSVEMGDEGNASIVLGESDIPYRKMMTWDPSAFSDFYLFDLVKKTRTLVAKRVKGNGRLSPKASYVFWFSAPDTAWHTYSVATATRVRLSSGIEKFVDEENDEPDYSSPYGNAGWTKDDQQFIVYDRYDLWAFDPEGKKAPVNLTKIGRRDKIVFRYQKLDVEERFIDPARDMILSAFHEETKASGYYKLSLRDGKLTKLIMEDVRFGGLSKARRTDKLMFTRESFREFPDVWVSDVNFGGLKKVTNANPQMKNYFWGSVEMVKWTSLDNIPLTGLLYKPEGFDPKKKYPMIVYFYDRESNNLHQHIPPTPLRSTINRSTYVSDGYIVFVPDIVYKIGFPGESAKNCILPGVTAMISKGFVDEKNIGVQGHSWGGYQIAYLVTRTNLFKAAEAGAVVANMISAYGGIRWGTGISRMFQYEHSQSRIGGTLWQKPMHFIENSPIFFADKIQTPMLLLHNDGDDAVPWYQGIEMYMALRRLDKPVWMLNYNGEPHWPVKRENRMDFQIRMKQFFDYYLKGAPEPAWMKDGVPAVEKGITKGY
jgi:dipeptidyl aminopeptidase/acylaminoacyl peptidase